MTQPLPENLLSQSTCPVCLQNRIRHWRILKGWKLDQCQTCGMIFVNPRPSDAMLSNAYQLPPDEYKQFFQTDYIDVEQYYNGNLAVSRKNSQQYLMELEKRLKRPGTILDIGCGTGVFLKEARKRAWATVGIDPGNWHPDADFDAVLNIQRCSFWDAKLDESVFDVVFMGSVLEHIGEPVNLLNKVHKLLKPGGILYIIGLPNIESWTIKLGIDKWIGNHPPAHLLYFSKKTAYQLFSQMGFTHISIQSYGMSETILEILFNRQNKYSGNYSSVTAHSKLATKAVEIIKRLVYKLFDITSTGSVLKVTAQK